ncbi:MAG TPA: hypothetical protein VGF42_00320 [Caulobacteraceae bacterium]|jgi:hypothetical protein
MKLSFEIALAAVGALTLLTAATGASAQTPWQHHHPRRVEVNHRLANQDRRIQAERREGELTGHQAHALHAEDRGIRGQERRFASSHHGHLTSAEQHRLNREENGVSGQIGR